jgi:hypothetical protein
LKKGLSNHPHTDEQWENALTTVDESGATALAGMSFRGDLFLASLRGRCF